MSASDERGSRIAAIGFDYPAAAKQRVPACNLCGSTDLAPAAERDRYGYPATMRVCDRCGLGFLSPRMTGEEYGRFYANVYRPLVSAYHGRTIDAETVQEDQLGYAADLAEFLRDRVTEPPATIMDVGGSTGIVGGTLGKTFDARVTVLDPAPDELAVAEAAGMETIAGFVEDFDPAGRTWDLVLLCQTIDHLLDVSGTLAAMRRMVSPRGLAFVDVLDVILMARRRGSIEGAVKIDHPYYLTRSTALGFFARAGFSVVADRLTDDNHWGFLLQRTEPAEPDWGDLARTRDELLAEAGD